VKEKKTEREIEKERRLCVDILQRIILNLQRKAEWKISHLTVALSSIREGGGCYPSSGGCFLSITKLIQFTNDLLAIALHDHDHDQRFRSKI